jgi:kinetochore protein NDC80
LREELHTEIERVLNDVIHFKIHVQKKLEDYELFVDDEVSREVADLERVDDSENAQDGAQAEVDVTEMERS